MRLQYNFTGDFKVPGLREGSGSKSVSPMCLVTLEMVASLKLFISSVAASELPSAGDGLSHQAAAPGVALLGHSQLRHATTHFLTQTVTQPARQILQVSPTSSNLSLKGPAFC